MDAIQKVLLDTIVKVCLIKLLKNTTKPHSQWLNGVIKSRPLNDGTKNWNLKVYMRHPLDSWRPLDAIQKVFWDTVAKVYLIKLLKNTFNIKKNVCENTFNINNLSLRDPYE